MNLNINYQATRDAGNNVIKYAEDFSALLENIKKTNSELMEYWQGEDAKKYSGAVSDQAQQMQNLATTIEEIGNFLVKVGNAYEAAMQQNMDAIN